MSGATSNDTGGASPLIRAGRWLRDDFKLFLARFDVARRWFRGRYMYADPRTLALTRWVIGLLLILDGARHWTTAERYYSNAGVVTNHWHLFRPSGSYNFSLFHAFSTPEEVHIAFAASLCCYFLFMVGYRSRLFNILSLVWVTSMDNRLVLVENGGYVVVNLIVFWLCFMPTGQRFSVDSLLASLRERRESTLAQLNERHRPAWLTDARHSLAAFILVLNFGVIYTFNTVNKYGDTWRAGETIHYVLHLDRMVTGLAVWMRESLPFWSLWLLNHLVLVMEASIVMLIFWPRNRRFTRPAAMLLVALLHAGFGTTMRLGPFSWFMIGWSTVLLMAVHWEALQAWFQRRVAPVEVCFDERVGAGWWWSRLWLRLDRGERLSFASHAGPGLLQARLTDGRVLEGRAAWWAIARALPGGRWLLPLARGLSLGLLDALVFSWQHHAAAWSRFFGWRVPQEAPPAPGPTRARRWWRKWVGRTRELALWYLLAASASQLINENKSIPEPIKHQQPAFVQATLHYPRLFQGWGMFAPNPIREDGIVAVDAITKTGKHVDPFTGEAPDLDLSDARGLGLGQIQQDYFNRIRLDRNKGFRKPLEEWIRRYYPLVSSDPDDEIVFFEVWWLTDRNPEPGRLEPTDHEAICIASWRHSRVRRVPGPDGAMITLPRPCTVRSAGK